MRGEDFDKNEGLVSLCIDELFRQILSQDNREFLIRISYIEIYNEEIIDLLSPNEKNLQIRESQEKGVYVAGVREVIVASTDQILEIMNKGENIRHTGATKMNERSSRSHTIFKLVIESKSTSPEDNDQAIRVAVLNLVDLAGSERVSKTGAEGQRLREGGNINKSLLTLSQVIRLLSEQTVDTSRDKSAYIPFRDSKLTRILQPALGGNAKTTIISCISPSSKHVDETHSTLRFSSQALKIQNNARINEVLSDAALLKKQDKEISRLKQQLEEQGFKGDQHQVEERLQALRDQLLQKDQDIERERNEKDYYKNHVKFLNSIREEEGKNKVKQNRRLTWAAKPAKSQDLDTSSDDQENMNVLNIPKKRYPQFDTIIEDDANSENFNQDINSNRTSPSQLQRQSSLGFSQGLDQGRLNEWLNDSNKATSNRKPLLNITNSYQLASVKEEDFDDDENRRSKKRKSTGSRSQFTDKRMSQNESIIDGFQREIIQLRYHIEDLENRVQEKDVCINKQTQDMQANTFSKNQAMAELQESKKNFSNISKQMQLVEIKCEGIQEDYTDLLNQLQSNTVQSNGCNHDAFIKQIDSKQSEIDNQIQINKNLELKLSEQEQMYEANKNDRNYIQEQLSQQVALNKELEQKFIDAVSQQNVESNDFNILKTTIKDLENKCQLAEQNEVDMQKSIQTLQEQCLDDQEKYQQLELKCSELQVSEQEQREICDQYKQINDQLKDQFTSEGDQSQGTFRDLQDRLEAQQKEYNDLKQSNDKMQEIMRSEIQQSQEREEDLKAQLESKIRIIQDNEAQFQNWAVQCQQKESRIEVILKENNDINAEKQRIEEQHQLAQQIIGELRKDKDQSDQTSQNNYEILLIESKQRELSSRQEYEQQIQALEDSIKKQSQQFEDLQAKNEQAIQDYVSQITKLEEQNHKQKQDKDQLKGTIEILENTIRQNQDNMQIMEDAKQQMQITFNNNIQQMEQDNCNLKQVKIDLQSQIDKLQQQIREQNEQVRREHSAQVAKLLSENQQAVTQNQENIEQEQAKLGQMQSKIQELQEKIVQLQQLNETTCQEKEQIIEAKEQCLVELQNFNQLKMQLESSVQDLNKQVQASNQLVNEKEQEIKLIKEKDIENLAQTQNVTSQYDQIQTQLKQKIEDLNQQLQEQLSKTQALQNIIQDKENINATQKDQYSQSLEDAQLLLSQNEAKKDELQTNLNDINRQYNEVVNQQILQESTIKENMEYIANLENQINDLNQRIVIKEQSFIETETKIKQEYEVQKESYHTEHQKEVQNIRNSFSKQKADLKAQLDQSMQSVQELNKAEKDIDEKKIQGLQLELQKVNKVTQDKIAQAEQALKNVEQLQQFKANSRQEISSLHMEIKQLKQANKGDSKDKEFIKKEVDKLKSKIQELESKYQAEKDKRFKIEHERTDFEKELKQLRAKFEAINKNKDKQTVVIDRKVDNLTKEKQQTTENLQSAHQQIHNLQSQIQHKVTDVAQKQAMINELEDKIASFITEIDEINKKRNDLDVELENHRSSNIALEEEIALTSQKYEDNQKDLRALVKKYKELEGNYQSTTKERDSFQEQLNQNQQQLEKLEVYYKEADFKYKDIQDQNQDLQDRVQDSESQFEELEKVLNGKQTQIYELLEQNESYKKDNVEIQAQLESQKLKFQKSQQELSKLKKQNQQVSTTKDSIQQELLDKSIKIENLKRDLQDNKLQMDDLKQKKLQIEDQLIRKSESLIEEKQEIMQSYEDLKSSTTQVIQQKEKIIDDIQSQLDQMGDLNQNEIIALKEQNQNAEQINQRLEQDIRQTLEQSFKDRQLNQQIQKEIEEYRQLVSEHENSIASLNADNTQILEQLQKTNENKNRLENALIDSNKQIEQYSIQLSRIEKDNEYNLQEYQNDVRSQMSSLSDQIQNLEMIKLQLESKIKEQSNNVSQLLEEKQEMEQIAINLHNQNAEMSQQNLKEQQQIQDAQQQLVSKYEEMQREFQESQTIAQQHSQQLKAECERLLREQASFAQKSNENQKIIQELQENNELLQEQLNHAKDMNTQNDSDLRKRCENLQQESKLANKLYQQIKEESQEKMQQKDNNILTLQAQAQEWRDNQQLSLQEIRTHESEIKSLNNQIRAQQAEIGDILKKLQKVDREKMALQNQMNQNGHHQYTNDSLQTLQLQIEEYKQQQSQLNKQLNSLVQENSNLQQQLQNSDNSQQQFNQVKQLKQEKLELEKKMKEYYQPKLIEYRSRLVQQGNMMNGMKEDLQKSGGDLSSFQKLLDYRSLEQNFQRVEQQNNVLDRKLKEIQSEYDNLNSCSFQRQEMQVLNGLKQDEKCSLLVNKYQDIKHQYQVMTQELNKYKQQFSIIEKKFEQQSKQLQQVTNEKGNLNQQIEQFFKIKLDEYKHRLQRQEFTIEKVKKDFIDYGGKYDQLKQVFHYRSIQYSYEEALKQVDEIKKKYEKLQTQQDLKYQSNS